jgi:hypothetical protein
MSRQAELNALNKFIEQEYEKVSRHPPEPEASNARMGSLDIALRLAKELEDSTNHSH